MVVFTAAEERVAAGLDPLMLPRMIAHRAAVLAQGIPFVLISGRRGADHQQALYDAYQRALEAWRAGGEQGDAPRPAAVPGSSWHEYGLAYDFTGPRTSEEWRTAGELAEAQGLESGHRYGDAGHVELPGDIDAARALTTWRLAATGAALAVAILAAAR